MNKSNSLACSIGSFSAVFLWLLLLSPLAYSAEITTLEDRGVIALNQGELSFYKDSTGNLTQQQIVLINTQGKFKQLDNNLSMGYVADTFWLYFSLEKQASQPSNWWLELMPAYLDDIQLFHVDANQKIDHRRAGDFLPQSAKEEKYRGTIFKLELSEGLHQFYIRIKTTSTVVASVKLWQQGVFNERSRHGYFAFGVYFSAILMVSIFNLINYLVSRRKIFIAYTLYLLINALQWFGVNGFIGEFFLPQQPLLANLVLGFSMSVGVGLAFIFFAMLFELKKYHRFIYRLVVIAVILSVVTTISAPLGYHQLFAPWLLLFSIFFLLFMPWPLARLWRSGMIWDRLLVLAFVIFAILVSLNMLSILGLLSWSESSIYVGMSGNIFHILLLHFALMLHYKKLEQEHSIAIEKAIVSEQQAKLEKDNKEQLSQLLTMISHEIRTPIAVIDGANESLKIIDNNKNVTVADQQNRINRYDRIQKAVMRMKMMMDMAMTQNHEKGLPYTPELLDFSSLTNEVIAISGVEAEKRINFDDEKQGFIVEADHNLLRIALLNLLDNALKYSPKNSDISITINQVGKDIVWTIEDQGEGIAAGMEQEIFKKFTRVNQQSSQSGMGLGLFLVAHIIKQHKGRIEVKNSQSGGAIFSLWLPKK